METSSWRWQRQPPWDVRSPMRAYGVQFADVGESNDPAQVDAGIPAPPQYPEAAVGTPSYGGQPVYAGQPDYSGQNGYTGNTPAGNMVYPGSTAESSPSQSMMNQFYRQAQVQGNMMGASVQQMKPTVAAPDIPLEQKSSCGGAGESNDL